MLGPLDGASDAPDAGHPLCCFVPHSGSLGGSDPTGRFCPGNLRFAGPSAIMGPVLDTIAISRDVEGASCEEFGWTASEGLSLCLLGCYTTGL
jgi:hypothetical protein